LKVFLVFVSSEILSLVLSILVTVVSGSSLDLIGKSMTWYSNPYLLPLLHSVPALLVWLKISSISRRFLNSKSWKSDRFLVSNIFIPLNLGHSIYLKFCDDFLWPAFSLYNHTS